MRCYRAAWRSGSSSFTRFLNPTAKPAVGFLFLPKRDATPITKTTMHKAPTKNYRPSPPLQLPDRQWPNRVLTRAPRWCSVDLRDGNQALAVPMNVSQKLELFQAL